MVSYLVNSVVIVLMSNVSARVQANPAGGTPTSIRRCV